MPQRLEQSTYSGLSSNAEVYLLENVPIMGRKTELRQLLKLLNLAREGQGKAVLLSGDTGIGKSALIDTFTGIVRDNIYSRVLDCRQAPITTAQRLYVTLINEIQSEAERILSEALDVINESLFPLGITWMRQDLIRAVSLVQLQESLVTGASGASPGKNSPSHENRENREQLIKAIRNSLPTVKKLKPSTNDHLEKLAALIMNPWVLVSASILNPIKEPMKQALDLARELEVSRELDNPNYLLTQQQSSKPRPAFFQDKSDTTTEDPNASVVTIDLPSTPTGMEPAKATLPNIIDYPLTISAPIKSTTALGSTTLLPEGLLGDMVGHLTYIFHEMNQGIAQVNSALLVLLDNWNDLSHLPAHTRQELRTLLGELLVRTTDQRQFHMMLILGIDTANQSRTLGGQLYHQFRTKLLLPELDENHARRLFKSPLKQAHIDLDESVHKRVYALTQGNPFWHLKAAQYLKERAQANRIDHIDEGFYEKLCIDTLPDLLELAFTRVKLTFLHQEASLLKVVSALTKQAKLQPFNPDRLIQEISISQDISDNFVYEVIQQLRQHDFITALTQTNKKSPVSYRIQSKVVLTFLQGKTHSIQTEISTDEKLLYLKKIIPLSMKSGELDREKTQEVLSLCQTLDNQDMIEFLETVFLDHLHDEKPIVRVTALNNLSLIDSDAAYQAVFTAMKDDEAMVREYAAQNLALLAQKTINPEFHRHVVETLVECIDDDYEAVRAQVYQTLGKYRLGQYQAHQDLMAIFIKGMSDASDAVRLTSVKSLADLETDSPFVKNALLDATNDPVTEIRKYACQGIQRYGHTGHDRQDIQDIIDALTTRLKTDTESSIRALAADALSHMDDHRALETLAEVLNDPHETEDVKLSVVRTLGKQRGWRSEEILLDLISNISEDDLPPALLWASVRSLGQVGGTDRSIHALLRLIDQIPNDIIQNAAKMALQKIKSRFDELRQLERQLGEATPTVMAVASEYEQEVILLEDDDLRIELVSDPTSPVNV